MAKGDRVRDTRSLNRTIVLRGTEKKNGARFIMCSLPDTQKTAPLISMDYIFRTWNYAFAKYLDWLICATGDVFFYINIVKEEEIYLESVFGNDYLEYKERVPIVLPIGWLKSKV